jgi:Na+-transporting NADH:ubiquinone oxidoreductase subunit C
MNNKYTQMVVFILILGIFTAAVLVGMDYLTADRIQANEEVELKSTLLDAYGIDYTLNEVNDIFDQSVEIIEKDGLIFYRDRETDAISFEFEGGGVWGPITGMLTLEADFETIQSVAIFEQEETPGLGGRITEEAYLNSFSGKRIYPEIVIRKDSAENDDNEVDTISGATRTSEAFETILNQNYGRHRDAWID